MWRLLNLFFGVRYVLLIDFEQEWKVRRVLWRADGAPYAAFFGFGIGRVMLLPNGKCEGASYVKRWIPLGRRQLGAP